MTHQKNNSGLFAIVISILIGVILFQNYTIKRINEDRSHMINELFKMKDQVDSLSGKAFECVETLQKFQTIIIKQKVISGNYGQMIAAQTREKIRRNGCPETK